MHLVPAADSRGGRTGPRAADEQQVDTQQEADRQTGVESRLFRRVHRHYGVRCVAEHCKTICEYLWVWKIIVWFAAQITASPIK